MVLTEVALITALAVVALLQNLSLRALESRVGELEAREVIRRVFSKVTFKDLGYDDPPRSNNKEEP